MLTIIIFKKFQRFYLKSIVLRLHVKLLYFSYSNPAATSTLYYRIYTLSKSIFVHQTGNVESLLQMTPWKWRHLNTSVKVDSPVRVDVSLTSHYRLTGKHFITKYLREYLKMFRSFTKIGCIYFNRIFRHI